MKEKTLKAAIAGMLLLQSGTLECKLNEKDLISQYLIVDEAGAGTLHRIYLVDEGKEIKARYKLEYDIIAVMSRQGKYLISFADGRCYAEQKEEVQK